MRSKARSAATIEEAERLSDSMDQAAADAIALATVDGLADRLAGSVVDYGSIAGGSLTRTSVPVLGHFAETDPFESDEGVARFEATLRSAGRDVVIHRYPDTTRPPYRSGAKTADPAAASRSA